MTIDDLQQIAKKLKGVTQDIKWVDHLCFNVGGKMFLVTSPETVPISASFKVSDEEFDELSEKTGFKQAPYFAKRKWVYVDDLNRLSKKEWEHYLRGSYELVVAKLSAKIRNTL